MCTWISTTYWLWISNLIINYCGISLSSRYSWGILSLVLGARGVLSFDQVGLSRICQWLITTRARFGLDLQKRSLLRSKPLSLRMYGCTYREKSCLVIIHCYVRDLTDQPIVDRILSRLLRVLGVLLRLDYCKLDGHAQRIPEEQHF